MLSDGVVWKNLKSGNHEALAQLYRQYVRILFSYGKKITPDEKLIEDSIQDLFIDLWQSRERLGDVETARFYLFRSLRRRIYKTAAKASVPLPDPDYFSALPITSQSHETDLILREENERTSVLLNDLIQNLPNRQGEAVLLYFYQNFEYHEIAEILSINEQSARNLIQRALEKLKKVASKLKTPFSILLISYLARLDLYLSADL